MVGTAGFEGKAALITPKQINDLQSQNTGFVAHNRLQTPSFVSKLSAHNAGTSDPDSTSVQLNAYRAHNPKVVGSNPAPATNFQRLTALFASVFRLLPKNLPKFFPQVLGQLALFSRALKLTKSSKQGYIVNAPAKSGARVWRLDKSKTWKRHNSLLCAFFMPCSFVMAARTGRPSGLPVFFGTGSPTWFVLSTLFGDMVGSVLRTLPKEPVAMSDEQSSCARRISLKEILIRSLAASETLIALLDYLDKNNLIDPHQRSTYISLYARYERLSFELTKDLDSLAGVAQ